MDGISEYYVVYDAAREERLQWDWTDQVWVHLVGQDDLYMLYTVADILGRGGLDDPARFPPGTLLLIPHTLGVNDWDNPVEVDWLLKELGKKNGCI